MSTLAVNPVRVTPRRTSFELGRATRSGGLPGGVFETVDYPNPYLHDLWGRAARARVGEGREGVR